jgi:hypothetical protein
MQALQDEFSAALPLLQHALPLPQPHVAYAQRWLMAHGLKWESSRSSFADDGADYDARAYIAAHWRRGDRGFSMEMGFGGRLQTMINRPERFAHFIKQQALRLNVRDTPSSSKASSNHLHPPPPPPPPPRLLLLLPLACPAVSCFLFIIAAISSCLNRTVAAPCCRSKTSSSSQTAAAHLTSLSCPTSSSPSAPTSSPPPPPPPLASSLSTAPPHLPHPPHTQPQPPPPPPSPLFRVWAKAGSSRGKTGSVPLKWRCRSRFGRASARLVKRHTSHVTRHTSHVTRHTSHVTRHTSARHCAVLLQHSSCPHPTVACATRAGLLVILQHKSTWP